MRRTAATCFLGGVLAIYGCGAREADPSSEATALARVAVVRPARGDVVRTITLPGDLVGFNQAALHAKVTGYLKRISVDKGDAVTKGQELAKIEVPELEQKLKRARANLAVRRGTFNRLKGIWQTDKRLVAREDVDVAEGQFEQASAEAEELEAMVGYTRIVAPFDGVVTARYVDPGALIEAGAHGDSSASGKGGGPAVVSIAELSRLRVYVYVPEEETSVVRRDVPATLTLREFPGKSFTGTVTRFASSLDLSTRTMLTEVDLENPDHRLYPGMYADVTLELVRHADVLKLPTSTIGGAADEPFVYIVRRDSLAKVPVTLGLVSDGFAEITSGLTGDEAVVATVSPGLSDGEKVRAVPVNDTVAAVTGAHAD